MPFLATLGNVCELFAVGRDRRDEHGARCRERGALPERCCGAARRRAPPEGVGAAGDDRGEYEDSDDDRRSPTHLRRRTRRRLALGSGLHLERLRKIPRAREPIRRRLRQRLRHRRIDAQRHRVAQNLQMRRLLRHQLRDHRLRARTGHRRLAREHLVEHRCERVHVAPRIDAAVARRLLGTHVLRRAEREPRLREAVTARFLHGERDAEIRQHRLAFLDQDVLGLDVAMHQALPVRVVERARDLLRDREGLIEPELPLAIELCRAMIPRARTAARSTAGRPPLPNR